MSSFKILKKCRICGSKNLNLIFQNGASPIGEHFLKSNQKKLKQKSYPIDYLCCKKCKLIQVKHIINNAILYPDYLYETKTSLTLNKHFSNLSRALANKKLLKKNSSILDIGSNDGTLLKNFKGITSKIIGIEPSKKISREANINGIKTINGFFDKKSVNKAIELNGKKKFSLITGTNVIANIDNLNDVFKNIKRSLDINGVFVFETFYLKSLVQNNVFDFLYHEHLSLFGIMPVMYICKKFNLKLYDIELLDTKGGSIRFYITHVKNSFDISQKLKIAILNEKKQKIYNKKFFLKLNKKKLVEKKIINNFLKNKDNPRRRIIGLGASISCVTLIYDFNLEYKIDYLIDDNRIKHNMLSPGSKILIKDASSFKFKKDDIILILAWRYKGMFLKKYEKKFKSLKVFDVWPKFQIIQK